MQITWWDWVVGFNRAADAFNRTHPGICVKLENVGAGTTEYTKLTTAFSAGTGAPDVAEIEYLEMPTFEISHDLVNLDQYGAQSLKNEHASWAWKQVSQGSAVYGLPFDAAPVALLYNKDLFARYNLAVPTTWAQFATDAETLHAKDPHAFITNFSPQDANLVMAFLTQLHAQPFTWTGGRDITINFVSPAAKSLDQYWQKLLDEHAIATTTDYSNQFYANLDSGTVATELASAWGPKDMAVNVTKTVGDWRLAPLPQWRAGQDVTVNNGGSAYAVTAQSKHPAQAATFVKWLTSSGASWRILSTPPSSEFPSYIPFLDSKQLVDTTLPLTGPQHLEAVFKNEALGEQYISFPPFMNYVATEFTDLFSPVANNKETMQNAMQKLQNALVSYAKKQGFTVSQ